MMSKYSIFMVIVVTIQLLSVYGELQDTEDDAFCLPVNVLCVKDVITKISKAAKDIRDMANKIESSILKKDVNIGRIQDNINKIRQTIMLHSSFPTSKYHREYLTMNNINKNDLINLLKEEYYIISYIYNSIKNLLPYRSIYDNEYDGVFNKTLDTLRFNMICNYRNIFNVYSENWQPIDLINSIRLLDQRKRNTTSIKYRSYIIFILQLTRQWMEKIQDILDDIENKII